MYAIHSNVLFIILQTTLGGFLLYNFWQIFLCTPSSPLFCWATKGTRFMERHRECAQAGWYGKPVCDVVGLHYTNLELPQAQVFSVCLLSPSGNSASGKEGIGLWICRCASGGTGLWICRSACAWAAALPDAASAQVHAHAWSVGVQCMSRKEQSAGVSCSEIWTFGNFPFLEWFIVTMSEPKQSTSY